jgi:hypothetical protein
MKITITDMGLQSAYELSLLFDSVGIERVGESVKMVV